MENKKAILYLRFSDTKQIGNTSIESQESICRNYCLTEGFKVVEIVKNEAVSASQTNVKRVAELLEFCSERKGKFDVLVGINLLREGLDIPEIGFIGILDADKEGFLRNARSLIQIIGRAARNMDSHVVLYADRQTDSIQEALAETKRRREMQLAFNKRHGITPKTIIKPIREKEVDIKDTKSIPKAEIPNMIIELEADMREAADALDFELAIALRDKMAKLRERLGKKQ